MFRARHARSTRSRARSLLAAAVLGPAALAVATVVPAHPAAAGVTRAAPSRAAASVRPVVRDHAVPAPSAVTATQHRVQPGETLSHVAARYGSSVSALASANGLSDPNVVIAGTVLSVPAAGPVATGGGGAVASGGSGLPSRLQASPTRLSYLPIFDQWASANGVPADLLKAMTWLESGWQNHLVSSTGAVGIGQLMPDTVDHMEALIGVDLDPAVVDDNIRMSARFLRWLLARSSSVEVALAGYYQGAASVARIGLLDETRTYVANVLALRGRF